MELCYVVIFTIIINSAMIDKHIKNLGKVYEMGWEWPFCSGVVQNCPQCSENGKNSEIHNVFVAKILIG